MTDERRLTTSVVVATKDRPELIDRLLESLTRQSLAPDEVLVVDNNSTASYAEVLRKYRDRLPLRSVVETTPGIVAARNRGIRESTGKIILFTDDDCVADRHWVESLVKPFYRDPNIGAVGGKTVWLNLATALIDEHNRADREAFGQ
jgi:glycosyltransferase involved in cell wall biosynthesis